tara:strand:+ start:132 stop:611 length:480 start_codon:yes stop_codon:yes gene_type:complete
MNFLTKRVQDILAKAANNVIEAAKANLKDGSLKKSLKAKKRKGSVEIIMADYGVFQDRGVDGANNSDFKGKKKQIHKSKDNYSFKGTKAIGGVKQIDRWMSKKGIGGDKNANFLIRRSIAQHGIKPSLFLTKPFEKYHDMIREEFHNLHKEIIKDIKNG